MAQVKYRDTVQDASGNVIAGAEVTILDAGTATPSSIYADDGTTPLANPLTTSAVGEFEFVAEAGDYDISVTFGAVTAEQDTVTLGGSGGGGSALVTYELSTAPGYGIVPETLVADYTALQAYTTVGNDWVEVADTGTTSGYGELYFWDGTYWLGPFPSSLKNAQYELGSNGEDVLLVTFAKADISFDTVSHTMFSQLPAITYPKTTSQTRQKVRRTGGCGHVFAPVGLTKQVQVINARTNEDHWLAIHGLSFCESENTVYGPDGALVSGTTVLAIGASGSSATVLPTASGNLVVRPMASGFADTPGMNNSTDQQDGDYLTTNDLGGVLEWEYSSLNGDYGTVAPSGGNVAIVLDQMYKLFQITVAGANTWTITGAPSNRITQFTVELTNGAAGVQTWPTGTLWSNGTEPTLSAGIDVIEFYSFNGGAWRAFHAGTAMAT